MLRKITLFTLLMIMITGCSSHVTKSAGTLPAAKVYAIGSFWNYTETPMAGLRAASIVEGVLARESVSLHSMVEGSDSMTLETTKSKRLMQQVADAKLAQADYLITGEVQEWRYKTGIDGEPVVSFTLKVLDLQTHQVLFSGVGAKSGWGHKSIGIVAQEIAEELVPQFTR